MERIHAPWVDLENEPCLYPGHNPPMHISLRPGAYTHVCPRCGYEQVIVVNGVYL